MSPSPFAAEKAAALAQFGPTVSLAEAARLVKVSRRTLQRAISAGEIRVYQFGRSRTYRIRVEDLFSMLTEV